MLTAWVLLPLLLMTAAAGLGGAFARVAGLRAPVLLLPLGYAVLVLATQFTTTAAVTCGLTFAVPVLGVLLCALRPQLSLREAVPPVLVTALAFSAPALLYLTPSFLGYGSLGDASVHFVLVDQLLAEGYGTITQPDSTYGRVLTAYFGSAYPTGAHGPLAALTQLLPLDVAWLFQPYLATVAALAVLPILDVLLREGVALRRAQVVAAMTIGAALVYAYNVQQQPIKEQAALVLILLLCSLVARIPAAEVHDLRGLAAAIAVTAAALLATLGLAAGAYLAPIAAVTLVAVFRNRRLPRRGVLAAGITSLLAVLLLAAPVLARAASFLAVAPAVLSAQEEFGNLQRKLSFAQVFGSWPAGDFRLLLPADDVVAWLLVGAATLACFLGAARAIEERRWGLLTPAVVSLAAFVIIASRASPWAHGKALFLLSPGIVLLGAWLVTALAAARARLQSTVLALLLFGGIAWSNALAYHDADPAPFDRLRELERIGEQFAGQGPTIYVEFEEFAKHFLRDLEPTGTNESFRPRFRFNSQPNAGRFGFSGDLDSVRVEDLARYRTAVLRRSPGVSRPPSGWQRVFAGQYYDVWQARRRRVVLRHWSLGDSYDAAGELSCSRARDLIAYAQRVNGEVVAARRPRGITVPIAEDVPLFWQRDGIDQETLRPGGPGRVDRFFRVADNVTLAVWLQASVIRKTTVLVNERPVGSVLRALNPRGVQAPVGVVRLPAGRHRLTVVVEGGSWRPGTGGFERLLGPITLTPANDSGAVVPVRATSARQLCAQPFDWIEVVDR